MAAESIYETAGDRSDARPLIRLPGPPPMTAACRPWLRWRFTDADDAGCAELGLATPVADTGLPGEPAVRIWPRGATATAADDAQVVVAWLRGNQLAERLGIDTDMLVHLFIETVVADEDGSKSVDGEYLSTLAGSAHWVGTGAGAQWDLIADLPAATVSAVLADIAASAPRWRYSIVAVQDPDSPAGRIRRRLLDDLGR